MIKPPPETPVNPDHNNVMRGYGTYRPPIEQVCGCGTKHTGTFRNCPVCQSYNSDRSNFI